MLKQSDSGTPTLLTQDFGHGDFPDSQGTQNPVEMPLTRQPCHAGGNPQHNMCASPMDARPDCLLSMALPAQARQLCTAGLQGSPTSAQDIVWAGPSSQVQNHRCIRQVMWRGHRWPGPGMSCSLCTRLTCLKCDDSDFVSAITEPVDLYPETCLHDRINPAGLTVYSGKSEVLAEPAL